MSITIPLFALRKGRTSGVEYAIFNLMQGLYASGSDLRVAHSNPDYLSLSVKEWLDRHDIATHRFPALTSSMASRFVEETIYAILDKDEHVIFPNYYLPPATPRLRHRSVFLMDVQHKVFPQFFSSRKVAWLDIAIKHMLANADRVLFISQFELDQTQRFYGGHFADRARVVHIAIDWDRFDRGPIRPNWDPTDGSRFILSVSQQYPHKRLDVLLRAFAMMASQHADLRLVLTGRPAPGLLDDVKRDIDESIARRIHFTGFVSDRELGQLYRQAEIFALPSVYEGFGMPAVEAMSFGKPALLADATAVPEATMGFARYLSPTAGPADWARELSDMIVRPPIVDEDQVQVLRQAYDPVVIANRLRRALKD